MARRSDDERRQRYLEKKKTHEGKRFQSQKKPGRKLFISPGKHASQHISILSGFGPATVSTRDTFWNEDDVEALDTAQIFDKLNQFGVLMQNKDFIDAVNQNDSAGEIVEKWRETFNLKASGLDDDFFWLAAKTLWKRLVPDKISSEQIVDMIEQCSGYDDALKIWDIIKERYGSRTKSIEHVDEMFGDLLSLSSWSGDLALNLLQSAEKDPSLYNRLQEYCEDFLTHFPESDEQTLAWMLVQLAQSFYGQGIEIKGNTLFRQVIEEFPDDPWNYILWGDMYWFRRLHDAIPSDLEKAKLIYAKALSRNITEGRADIQDRMKDLEALIASKKS